MKHYFTQKTLLMLSFMTTTYFMSSCSNEDACDLTNYSVKQSKSVIDNPFKWDESYHPQSTRANIVNEAYEFVPEGLTAGAYLGELIIGNTISTPPLKPITGESLDKIDIAFDMPSYYCATIKPYRNDYNMALEKALHNPDFSGEQTEQFEYDLKRFTDYNEVRLAFGANVNVCRILEVSGDYSQTKIRHKTGLFARVYQKNFTASMDYPEDGNLFANNDDLKNHNNDAYVNTISYGRMAIISIESDYSYDSLKTAFKASLSLAKLGVGASLDYNSKKILDQAEIKVRIIGGNGKLAAQTFEGLEHFTDFIKDGGTFSANQPGVPIYITANRLDDNSVWVSHFDFPDIQY